MSSLSSFDVVSTLTFYSVRNNYYKLFAFTLLLGTKKNTFSEKDNISLLELLIQENRLDMLKIFLKHNLDLDAPLLPSRQSPLTLAIKNNNKDVVSILIDHGAKINDQEESYLILALERGHTQMVNLLLKKGLNPNGVHQKTGQSALTYFIHKNDLVSVRVLLKIRKIDLNQKDSNEITPLSLSIQLGRTEMLKLLLKNGAQTHTTQSTYIEYLEPVLVTSMNAQSQLSETVFNSHFSHESDSLGYKPSETLKKISGFTPLTLAVRAGQIESAKILIASDDVDCTQPDNFDKSPLIYAIEFAQTDLLKLLLSKNISQLDAFAFSGYTPMTWAIKKAQPEIIEILIEHSADLNQGDLNGATPLSLVQDLTPNSRNFKILQLFQERNLLKKPIFQKYWAKSDKNSYIQEISRKKIDYPASTKQTLKREKYMFSNLLMKKSDVSTKSV